MAGPADSVVGDACYTCHETWGDKTEWIGCELCPNWSHLKCAYLNGVKPKNIVNINWICTSCLDKVKLISEFNEKVEAIKEKICGELSKIKNEFKSQCDVMQSKLNVVTESLPAELVSADSSGSQQPQGMWSEVVKRKRKRNLLVVKATDKTKKASELKGEVAQALNDVQIQIDDSRFTEKGNIVMNFENDEMRNEAAKKLESVENVTTQNVKKFKPKIMLCNVHKEEEKETILTTLLERNDYLNEIPEVKSKLDLIFSKPAAGGTNHYIIRCDPVVREMIHKHHDRIKLQWGVYNVRDRYHVLICYHCQRYGHQEANCTSKNNGEASCCFKCAGNHRSKDCTNTEKTCINCVRFKKPDVNHIVMDSCCPVYQGELERVRNMTDHGY